MEKENVKNQVEISLLLVQEKKPKEVYNQHNLSVCLVTGAAVLWKENNLQLRDNEKLSVQQKTQGKFLSRVIHLTTLPSTTFIWWQKKRAFEQKVSRVSNEDEKHVEILYFMVLD